MFPAFGMAEVAIAGTFPEPMSGMQTDCVDRRVLETERYAAPVEPGADNSRRLALLGRAVPGLEIRIVDPETGAPLREREVGELEINGTSVTPGYYRRPTQRRVFHGAGWHRDLATRWVTTGDVGRIKES